MGYEMGRLTSLYVERAIEIAKAGGDENLEKLKEWIYDDELAESVFEEVPKRYADKEGSYVKITRLI